MLRHLSRPCVAFLCLFPEDCPGLPSGLQATEVAEKFSASSERQLRSAPNPSVLGLFVVSVNVCGQ
jgi:hypothetical protein